MAVVKMSRGVIGGICEYAECKSPALFGHPLACSKHNFGELPFLTAPRCQESSCVNIAVKKKSEAGTFTHCVTCGPDFPITDASCCACGNMASYILPGSSLMCCSICKTNKMVLYKKKVTMPIKCKNCHNFMIYSDVCCSKCNGYNLTKSGKKFREFLFNIITKSNISGCKILDRKMSYLMMFSKIPLDTDRKIRMPGKDKAALSPVIIKTPNRYIVVETDTTQMMRKFSRYATTTRMITFQKKTKFPVSFIMFNPDNYKLSSDGKLHSLPERIKILKDTIKILSQSTIHTLSVVYLFYDEFSSIEIQKVIPDIQISPPLEKPLPYVINLTPIVIKKFISAKSKIYTLISEQVKKHNSVSGQNLLLIGMYRHPKNYRCIVLRCASPLHKVEFLGYPQEHILKSKCPRC